MDTNAAKARIDAAAEALWQIKLEQPIARLNNGLEITRLPAGTLAESEHDARRAGALLRDLEGIEGTALAETDRLTLDFLRHGLSQATRGPDDWWITSPVAPYSSYAYSYNARNIIGGTTPDSAPALERRVVLWVDFATALRTARQRLDEQAARGWRLAQPAIPACVGSWRGLRRMLEAQLSPASDGLNATWAARAERLREREVLPAIDNVIDALADPAYAAAAPAEAGLIHLPGGEAAYRRLIEAHLTIERDPQRIHEDGLDEVRALVERMRQVRSRLGFAGSEAEFHQQLKRDPRVIVTTPEEVAERYQRCMARIEPLLPQWFSRLPRSPYGVERLAPELEAGMTYGYYDQPKAPGERGIYHYNASNLAERSQLQVAALIYHELAPGHHFHLARQMELDHLPALRRNAVELSVFNEGWAEYASGLGEEMGLYDDPYDLYGRLAHERFTAQRLVVDTGMNALGWSLERARAYMQQHTLEGEAQIASETLRYSTDLPAQALAYRLGYRWFSELRAEAAQRLGSRFDVRDFHEAVLGEGALPLPVLRAHVQRAMAAR